MGLFDRKQANTKKDMKTEGRADTLRGKFQHAWGELTDNNEMKARGRRTKAKGKAKETGGRVQRAIDALKR